MIENWQKYLEGLQQHNITAPSPSTYLVHLPHHGILKITGQDACQFLQGQLTIDVTKLSPNHSILGAYCNIKGRLECLYQLWKDPREQYFLRLPVALCPTILKELQKYAVFSKVTLTDLSESWIGFGITTTEENISSIIQMTLPETLTMAIRTSTSQIEYYGPIQDAIPFCANQLAPYFQNVYLPTEQWDLLDIAAGIPNIYPETANNFLAHDLNLPELQAVDFSKGCYRGQEIVARMQHRGNPKRAMYAFQCFQANDEYTGEIIPGTALMDSSEKSIGTVVRSVYQAATQTHHGLSVLPKQGDFEAQDLIVIPKGSNHHYSITKLNALWEK